jgi:hypothetical protein
MADERVAPVAGAAATTASCKGTTAVATAGVNPFAGEFCLILVILIIFLLFPMFGSCGFGGYGYEN